MPKKRIKFIKPNRIPEANVQAEIYRKLRNRDIRCCLEYRMEVPEYGNYLRADIAVLVGDYIACLIECKSRVNGKVNKNGRQYKKYLSLGLPTIYCMSIYDVNETVSRILDIIKNDNKE